MPEDVDCNHFQNKDNFEKVYMTLLENGFKRYLPPTYISQQEKFGCTPQHKSMININ